MCCQLILLLQLMHLLCCRPEDTDPLVARLCAASLLPSYGILPTLLVCLLLLLVLLFLLLLLLLCRTLTCSLLLEPTNCPLHKPGCNSSRYACACVLAHMEPISTSQCVSPWNEARVSGALGIWVLPYLVNPV